MNFSYPQAAGTLDWLGLNYYTQHAVKLKFGTEPFVLGIRDDQVKTGTLKTRHDVVDMDYGIYPEGMYRSLHKLAVLKVPIYITENGIADEKDDRRKFWIQSHLHAMYKAMEEGIDIRGFFYWSLMDNFGMRFSLIYEGLCW